MSRTQAHDVFAVRQGHKYMSLTTFRKSGKAVPTPVLFAEDNGKLYVSTRAHSGKVKRIRNNPQVQLAPCTARGKIVGQTIEAVTRILPSDEEALVIRALRYKYFRVRVSMFLSKLRFWGKGKKRVYLEIMPARGGERSTPHTSM